MNFGDRESVTSSQSSRATSPSSIDTFALDDDVGRSPVSDALDYFEEVKGKVGSFLRRPSFTMPNVVPRSKSPQFHPHGDNNHSGNRNITQTIKGDSKPSDGITIPKRYEGSNKKKQLGRSLPISFNTSVGQHQRSRCQSMAGSYDLSLYPGMQDYLVCKDLINSAPEISELEHHPTATLKKQTSQARDDLVFNRVLW